jgi:hypothetical protein
MDVTKERLHSDDETKQMPSRNNVNIMSASEDLSYLVPVPEGKKEMVSRAVCICSLFKLCAEFEHTPCCTVGVLITSIYGNVNRHFTSYTDNGY